jgi:hypothetical protein
MISERNLPPTPSFARRGSRIRRSAGGRRVYVVTVVCLCVTLAVLLWAVFTMGGAVARQTDARAVESAYDLGSTGADRIV